MRAVIATSILLVVGTLLGLLGVGLLESGGGACGAQQGIGWRLVGVLFVLRGLARLRARR